MFALSKTLICNVVTIPVFLAPGLTMHATILAYMFTLVEENKITSPLFDPTKVQAASNMDYIQKYVAELLKQAFPHLQEYVHRGCFGRKNSLFLLFCFF